MEIKALDLKLQYKKYKREIDAEIKSVIAATNFIQGAPVREFEAQLASYLGVKAVVGCCSGTDALFLGLNALGIKPGDEVITTSFTFIATAEAISYLGAKPVFVDIDPETFNINTELIEKNITEKTKAIVPVSLFGEVSAMKEITRLAKKYKLAVLEDAAQSIGGSYHGIKSGNLSPLAATSFFPSKPLGGYGDGGAVIVQKNAKLEERVRSLLNHGQTKRYHHKYIGINGRLDTLQAAVLKVKLKYLDEEVKKRQSVAEFYRSNLDPDLYTTQKLDPESSSAWAQFSLVPKMPRKASRKKSRTKILSHLSENKIPYAIYYPIPIHLQEAFRYLGYQRGDLPVTEDLAKEIFAIPIHPFLKKEEIGRVIEVLNEA